jgi:hypothetical protein
MACILPVHSSHALCILTIMMTVPAYLLLLLLLPPGQPAGQPAAC